MRQLAEDLKTGFDFIASEIFEPFRAKALDGKRPHDPAIEESTLDDLAMDVFLGSDVPHETAGEGVARARRVLYLFDGQCRSPERVTSRAECAIAEENGGAIFAVLDDQRFWPHGENFAGSARQAGFLRQHFRLAVIDHEDVYQSESFAQFL